MNVEKFLKTYNSLPNEEKIKLIFKLKTKDLDDLIIHLNKTQNKPKGR